MLGKLIKYEFRSTALFFLPIYAALIIISALTSALYRLAESFNSNFFNFSLAASVSLYVLLAVGLAVTTFVIIIIRFYKNLLGNEGYLMFTLPVSAEENVLGKLIPAVVWFLGSCVLGLLTIVPILNFRYSDLDFLLEGLDGTPLSIIERVLFIVLMLTGTFISFLFLYLCMSIGQTFNSHKFLASAVTMIAIQSAMQIISIMLIAFLSTSSVIATAIFDFAKNIYLFGANTLGSGFFPFLLFATVFSLAVAALLFFLVCRILRKKLNLN